jgi:hypothetical protein
VQVARGCFRVRGAGVSFPMGVSMKVLLRTVSVVFWAIAAFLVYAVVHAMASAGGARAGVAVGYVAGAIVLSALGVWLWRVRGSKPKAPAAA